MKTFEGVDVQIHVLLTSALPGREWAASRAGRFTYVENVPSTHWIPGCVDTGAGVDDVERRKFLILSELE
jgi:hypothetical protein